MGWSDDVSRVRGERAFLDSTRLLEREGDSSQVLEARLPGRPAANSFVSGACA